LKAFQKDTSNFDAKQRAAYKLEVWDLWKKAFSFRPVTESVQRMQFEAMYDLNTEYNQVIDHVVLALIEGDQKKAEKEITDWNATFPEAPISGDAIAARIRSKILSREFTLTERGIQNLPKNLRAPFLEFQQQVEKEKK